MKICTTCKTVFEKDFPNSRNNLFNSNFREPFRAIYDDNRCNECPLRNCHGTIIEIDENLFEVYKILNEKGYPTIACCSGHVIKDYTYINFQGNLSFSSLPNGFIEKHRKFSNETYPQTIIVKNYDNKLSSIELQKQLWSTAQDILNWAECLEIFSTNGADEEEDD